MAVTQNTYTGDGTTVLFSFTFPYLETTDIKVSLNGTITTAYTLANATTIQFNTAPANGAAIRIYRETDDSSLQATFYPGSAIRSSDLNDNFTQNLYVTQEANNVSASATTTANTALTNANTAISTANGAVSTANTALANSSAAVSTANTASTNASAAVSTANTASSNATTALNTANSASTSAATALSTANTALSTANTASSNASAAVSTANTASTNASAAVSTANTASSNASSAVSTANTASSNASTALSTANTAISTANAAASAVANAILYDTVANVAAIPGSPSNNDAVEVVNSTGIQSFTPLSGLPSGFVGDSGLSVRLVYTTTGATWNWIQYFPNDPEDRYGDAISTLQSDVTAAESDITTLQSDVLGLDTNKLAIAGGTMTGALGVTAGTAASPSVFISGDTNTGIYSPGADQLAISTNGTGRLFIDSSGRLGLGSSTPATLFEARSANTNSARIRVTGTGTTAGNFRGYEFGNGSVFKGGLLQDESTDLISIFTPVGGQSVNITSAGAVGIGTTSPSDALHVQSSAGNLRVDTSTNGGTASLLFDVPATNGFRAGHRARISCQHEGSGWNSSLVFYAGDASTPPGEALRIDSSRRLLVGTSTSAAVSDGEEPFVQVKGTDSRGGLSLSRFSNDAQGCGLYIAKSRGTSIGSATIVANGDELGRITFSGSDGTDLNTPGASIKAEVDGTPGANDLPTRLVFSTTKDGASTPTERMRITAVGEFRYFSSSGAGTIQYASGNAASSNPLFTLSHSASGINGGTDSFTVAHNGDVKNTNNSYGAISDIKLKENVVDANSQWNDLKSLRVVNYNLKPETKQETHKQLGLIAQEVELVSPGLVSESPDRDEDGNETGEVTKSVNYSVLYMKAVKALQEAMERIEALEAKVAALEGV